MKTSEKSKTAEKVTIQTMAEEVCIGRVPVMVKSKICNLSDVTDPAVRGREDCAFDIGGYFIIKGSEKVRVPIELIEECYHMICC